MSFHNAVRPPQQHRKEFRLQEENTSEGAAQPEAHAPGVATQPDAEVPVAQPVPTPEAKAPAIERRKGERRRHDRRGMLGAASTTE
jgi:hypothetical protein